MNLERPSEDRALEIISLVREKFSIESPQVSINKEYSLNILKMKMYELSRKNAPKFSIYFCNCVNNCS